MLVLIRGKVKQDFYLDNCRSPLKMVHATNMLKTGYSFSVQLSRSIAVGDSSDGGKFLR